MILFHKLKTSTKKSEHMLRTLSNTFQILNSNQLSLKITCIGKLISILTFDKSLLVGSFKFRAGLTLDPKLFILQSSLWIDTVMKEVYSRKSIKSLEERVFTLLQNTNKLSLPDLRNMWIFLIKLIPLHNCFLWKVKFYWLSISRYNKNPLLLSMKLKVKNMELQNQSLVWVISCFKCVLSNFSFVGKNLLNWVWLFFIWQWN